MEWDREVTERLEAMSNCLRERRHARLVEIVCGEGRDRVTVAGLAASRSA